MEKQRLILLDEHTSPWTPRQQEVLKLTDKLVAAEKITTLMVTHNLEQALSMGNRTIMMMKGELFSLSGKNARRQRYRACCKCSPVQRRKRRLTGCCWPDCGLNQFCYCFIRNILSNLLTLRELIRHTPGTGAKRKKSDR